FAFTGDFTIEFWMYQTGNGTTDIFIWNCAYPAVVWANTIYCFQDSAGTVRFYYQGNSTGTAPVVPVVTGAWRHWAFVRSGTTTSVFCNGVGYGSVSSTTFLPATVPQEASKFNNIGSTYGSGNPTYFSEVRVTSVARYAGATYTVPPAAMLTTVV